MSPSLLRKNLSISFGLWVWIVGFWWLSDQFVVFSNVSDGLFYTGDAIRTLEPYNFTKDVFFLAQTQGDFSIFGKLYGYLIEILGIKQAGLLVSTMGRLLWGAAAIALAHTLWGKQEGDRRWLWSLALMLLLPNGYDSERMFFYGAADVTPRTWAEAWVLWSLVARLRGRSFGCVALMGAALLFHPLMALPGLGLHVFLLPGRFWIGGLAVALGIGVGGALLGVGPLSQLFVTFDPLWWECVVVLAGQVLIASWSTLTLVKAGCTAALLLATARWHPESLLRRWAGALFVVQGLSFGLWWIGCSTHNVLLLQLQPWRVLWLCQLLAPALWFSSLPPWRQWTAWHGVQATLVGAAVISNSLATAGLFGIGLLLQWPWMARRLNRERLPRIFLMGAVTALAMSLMVRFPDFENRAKVQELGGVLIHGFWVSVAQEPMWTLPFVGCLAYGLAWFGLRRWHWASNGLVTLPVAWLCVGIATGQVKDVFTPLPDATALMHVVPSGSLVYWDAGMGGSWFALRRGQYLSAHQGAGALFSREGAMEYRRRLAYLAQVGVLGTGLSTEDITQMPNRASSYTDEPDIGTLSPLSVFRARLDEVEAARQPLDGQTAQKLCLDPILDRVLVSARLPEATWQVPYSGSPDGVISVIRCKPESNG